MNPLWWILIAIVIVAVVATAVAVTEQQRRHRLQQQFGPEYERTVRERGDRRAAERELSGRYERRQQLDIRPLPEDQRLAYDRQWRDIQARFVDAPNAAVGEADTLVMAVMRDRGYPVADFDQRAADVSVDHAGVVSDYRAAHDISQRSARGQASTEDLRQAMVHYRSLFQELLSSGAETHETTRTR